MTVWCAGLQEFLPNLHTRRSPTYSDITRCRIATINSTDDGHKTVRNMYRIEINVHEKELCVKLVITKIMSSVRCLDSSETKYPVTPRPLPQERIPTYMDEET